uniref:Cation channel sperm associated auxiliary subunit gamma n=1 Tax=Pelusios castaneus TaxID=367368 RepID=A0A8C8S281_9SAUR
SPCRFGSVMLELQCRGTGCCRGQLVLSLNYLMSVNNCSYPLWFTFNQAPVLILSGFPAFKIILVSDSGFADFTAVEVEIDSCWISSNNCPLTMFSTDIFNAIATESTLFIRQNQLVYYFTGNYSVLSLQVPGSSLWTRALTKVCVSKLNPVHFHHNGSEYVIVLGGGWQEGEFFLGTIHGMMCRLDPHHGSQDMLLPHLTHLLSADTEKAFVMLLGPEEYTASPLIPRGLSYNPFSTIFYVWGNVILQSYDLVNYVHLFDFPKRSHIRYFVQSYAGEFVCVTDSEEIWFSVEGSSVISRLYPSEAWNMHLNLQLMRDWPSCLHFPQSSPLLYFSFQLVYVKDGRGEGKLIKRKFPLHYILSYQHLIVNQYQSFFHPCSFSVMRIEDLPAPQRFTRMEHYRTEPPDVMDRTGFHNNMSLAVYQGLIYQLLWLHFAYSRPYADPVHDPIWRWWKNRKQYAEYFFYVASNGNSSGGVYVNMESYVKIYDLQPNNKLPNKIYLDKNNVYSFSVFLSIRSTEEMGETPEENSLDYVWLTVVLAHPKFVVTHLHRQDLIGRGSVLYKVSGFGVAVSTVSGCSFVSPSSTPLQGYAMVPLFIGCPPGKRLAFDITNTLKYTTKQNKRYFNCLQKNPEMPCFFFNDGWVSYQHVLCSNGSYTLKIIGGGPYSENRIRFYSLSEILDYNTEKGRASWQVCYSILKASSSSCRWVCEQNSPCYDVVPLELTAPDYFFLVEVSNRAVDKSTYCDYDLEFVIHIHGLRLSRSRGIAIIKVSTAILTGIVFLYIVCRVLGPKVLACFARLMQRLEEAITVRTGELWPGDAIGEGSSRPHCPGLLLKLTPGTGMGAAWQHSGVITGAGKWDEVLEVVCQHRRRRSGA